MTQQADRRFMPRVQWEVDIEVEVGGQRIPCRCADISQTGVRIHGSWSAHRGQNVRVFLPLEVGRVEATGEVIWTSNAPHEGWGVRFTSVHPVARRQIARFVIARLRERPEARVEETPSQPAVQPQGTPLRGAVPWSSIRDIPLARSEDPRAEVDPPRTPPWQQPSAPSPLDERRAAPNVEATPPRRAVVAIPMPPAPEPSPEPQPQPQPTEPPALEVLPCNPAMRGKLQELLDSGLASGSIIAGAKEAMSARGDLFLRVDTGPVVVLPGDDPLAGRLRWLAAAVATWSGSDEPQLRHGPDVPLTIRI